MSVTEISLAQSLKKSKLCCCFFSTYNQSFFGYDNLNIDFMNDLENSEGQY